MTSLIPILEEETIKVLEVVDSSENSDEDFGVFYQSFPTKSLLATFSSLPFTQASISQDPSSIPTAMVLQCKQRTSLFELLESHAGGATPEVAVQP